MITRKVYIEKNQIIEPIHVTYGTNTTQLAFDIVDITFVSATITFYNKCKGYITEQSGSVSNGMVVFTPEAGFFFVGDNLLTCEITNGTDETYTFGVKVVCHENAKYDGTTIEVNTVKTYAEQAAESATTASTSAQTASEAAETATTAAESATAATENLAPEYSTTSTYSVGDYVLYNSVLYKCISEITTAEAWTAAHWSQVTVGDEVSGLREEFTQFESAYLSIEQGYWNAIDGKGGVTANWVRTKGFLPSGIIIKSKIRMLLQAWAVDGTYIGTWDGTTFGNAVVTSGYLYDISINDWMNNYPAYLFKITWSKSPTTPTEVYDGLTVVFATDELNTLKSAIGIDFLSFYSDGTAAHSSTVNQVVKTIPSGDRFYFVFHADIAIQNNVQLIAFYTDNTSEIIQQNLIQDEVYGLIASKTINRFGVHTTAQSSEYTFMQIIGDKTSVLSAYVNSLVIKEGQSSSDRQSLLKNADNTFLFFSDVHAGSLNVQRLFSFADSVKPDAIINGGDTVSDLITNSLVWYNTLVDNCAVDALNCVGNHDMWTAHNVMDTPQNVYDAIIAPVAQKVEGIVQPENASANGLCYYYKDYGNVRIIVLAALVSPTQTYLWTTDQLNWFASALESARTSGRSVICVNHSPYDKSNAVIDADLPLNSWANYKTYGFDNLTLNNDAVNAVDTFKNNGGSFICWLSGHTHADFIMHHDLYSGQLMINIATARTALHFDGAVATRRDDILYDCFDYLGVDLTHKMLKVLRVGYNEDASMRIRNRFAYDYGNNKLLSYS